MIQTTSAWPVLPPSGKFKMNTSMFLIHSPSVGKTVTFVCRWLHISSTETKGDTGMMRLCSSTIRFLTGERKYDNYIFNEDSFSQEAESFLFNTLSDFTTKAFAKGLPAQSMIALIEILSLMLPTNAQAKPLITAHRLFHRPCAF